MLRREAIRRISICLGGTVSAPVLSGILAGCSAPESSQYFSPRSLSSDQFEVVGLIAESILPRTSTPGALDAGVDRFIDTLLTDYYSTDNRRALLIELEDFVQRANSAFPESFVNLTTERQKEFVKSVDEETFPSTEDEVSVKYTDVDEPAAPDYRPFFWQLKEWVLAGYYTSEMGATEELHIAPFSEYQGDFPLDSVGKTWA
jgi:gluconate 2-dehydrogenase gamma chain